MAQNGRKPKFQNLRQLCFNPWQIPMIFKITEHFCLSSFILVLIIPPHSPYLVVTTYADGQKLVLKTHMGGTWQLSQLSEQLLISAQVMILRSWNRAPHLALYSEGNLLQDSLSLCNTPHPTPHTHSFSLSQINSKSFFKMYRNSLCLGTFENLLVPQRIFVLFDLGAGYTVFGL